MTVYVGPTEMLGLYSADDRCDGASKEALVEIVVDLLRAGFPAAAEPASPERDPANSAG